MFGPFSNWNNKCQKIMEKEIASLPDFHPSCSLTKLRLEKLRSDLGIDQEFNDRLTAFYLGVINGNTRVRFNVSQLSDEQHLGMIITIGMYCSVVDKEVTSDAEYESRSIEYISILGNSDYEWFTKKGIAASYAAERFGENPEAAWNSLEVKLKELVSS